MQQQEFYLYNETLAQFWSEKAAPTPNYGEAMKFADETAARKFRYFKVLDRAGYEVKQRDWQ